MIHVDVLNEQEIKALTDEQLELIKRVIQKASQLESVQNGEVVVTLVDDDEIHKLNMEYRGIDRPTDVLSFAMNEGEEFDIQYDEEDLAELEDDALGDVIISIPRAISQAEEYGHSFERELGFLSVHGFLHLMGYDHETEEDEKVMFAKQEQVLEELNILR